MPPDSISSAAPALWYQCQRCGHCCRQPGFVHLRDSDICAIARFLKMSEWDFIQRHTRLLPNRGGLALTEAASGACIFLEERGGSEGVACAIQAVKPHQCKGFPNTWNFPGWRDVCEAVAG